MDNKQNYSRTPGSNTITKSYKIIERLYSNGDIKFYILVVSEYTDNGLVFREEYYKENFDDIDTAKIVIKYLRSKEESSITLTDKIYDVTFDENKNIKIDEKCRILDYKNIPNNIPNN